MEDVTIEFETSDAYFREFYREWRASVSREAKVDRKTRPVVAVFVGLAIVTPYIFSAGPIVRQSVHFMAGVLGLALLVDVAQQVWRHQRWYRIAKASPIAGRVMRLRVTGGQLEQTSVRDGDPRYEPQSSIVVSPRGYFVKYLSREPIAHGVGVSKTAASLYIPHRSITPSVTKESFVALLSAMEVKGMA